MKKLKRFISCLLLVAMIVSEVFGTINLVFASEESTEEHSYRINLGVERIENQIKSLSGDNGSTKEIEGDLFANISYTQDTKKFKSTYGVSIDELFVKKYDFFFNPSIYKFETEAFGNAESHAAEGFPESQVNNIRAALKAAFTPEEVIPCVFGYANNEYVDEVTQKILEEAFSVEKNSPEVEKIMGDVFEKLEPLYDFISDIGDDEEIIEEKYCNLIMELDLPYDEKSSIVEEFRNKDNRNRFENVFSASFEEDVFGFEDPNNFSDADLYGVLEKGVLYYDFFSNAIAWTLFNKEYAVHLRKVLVQYGGQQSVLCYGLQRFIDEYDSGNILKSIFKKAGLKLLLEPFIKGINKGLSKGIKSFLGAGPAIAMDCIIFVIKIQASNIPSTKETTVFYYNEQILNDMTRIFDKYVIELSKKGNLSNAKDDLALLFRIRKIAMIRYLDSAINALKKKKSNANSDLLAINNLSLWKEYFDQVYTYDVYLETVIRTGLGDKFFIYNFPKLSNKYIVSDDVILMSDTRQDDNTIVWKGFSKSKKNEPIAELISIYGVPIQPIEISGGSLIVKTDQMLPDLNYMYGKIKLSHDIDVYSFTLNSNKNEKELTIQGGDIHVVHNTLLGPGTITTSGGCFISQNPIEFKGEVYPHDIVLKSDVIRTKPNTDASIHLSGKSTLDGDFIQNSGSIYIEDGDITITGDAHFQTENNGKYVDSPKCLYMKNNKSHLTVNGDFFADCRTRYYYYFGVYNEGTLKNGVLELKGDFYQYRLTPINTGLFGNDASSDWSFTPNNGHTLFFNGNGEQHIYCEGNSDSVQIGKLKIGKNASIAVSKKNNLKINKLLSGLKSRKGVSATIQDIELKDTDTVINGDIVLNGQLIIPDNHSVTITGTLKGAAKPYGTISVGKKSILQIDGDYYIYDTNTTVNKGELVINGSLEMSGHHTMAYVSYYGAQLSLYNSNLTVQGNIMHYDYSGLYAENSKVIVGGNYKHDFCDFSSLSLKDCTLNVGDNIDLTYFDNLKNLKAEIHGDVLNLPNLKNADLKLYGNFIDGGTDYSNSTISFMTGNGQYVSRKDINYGTIVLEADGVVFKDGPKTAVLFNHKGHDYTIEKKNTSKFVDYDGDGQKDNDDEHPTVFDEDNTAPNIKNITVSNINESGYTIECKVSDDVNIDKVQFLTWTDENEKDDLTKIKVEKKNGIYSYQVKISDHNNEAGLYYTEIRAYDLAGNKSTSKSKNVIVPINDYVPVTAKDITLEYDGKSHGIDVLAKGKNKDYTKILYSNTQTGEYTKNCSTIKNEGSKKIYWKATSKYYTKDTTGCSTVTITQISGKPEVSVKDIKAEYDGTPHTLIVQDESKSPEDTVVKTSDSKNGTYKEKIPTITEPGTIEIYWEATNPHYSKAKEGIAVITVTKGKQSPIVSDYEGEYDGNPHTINIDGVVKGTKILYKENKSDDWQSEPIYRKEIGTTTVYFKLEKKNYKSYVGNAFITIKSKANETDVKPENEDDKAPAKDNNGGGGSSGGGGSYNGGSSGDKSNDTSVSDKDNTEGIVSGNSGEDTKEEEIITAINDTSFPDPIFRQYVLGYIDRNKDGNLSKEEVLCTYVINIQSRNISDLTGIKYFTELKNLCFRANNIHDVDLSNNTKIEVLDCTKNLLPELDVSNNTQLSDLKCGENYLTELDLTKNINLRNLSCNDNELTNLNVSSCTGLYALNCYNNKLATLDIYTNKDLYSLSCYQNTLSEIDVSENNHLSILSCDFNKLTQLILSNNTELERLSCSNNQLEALDLKNNIELKQLGCSQNKLTQLDVSKNIHLESLNCFNNQLAELDVSHNLELTSLFCYSNQLSRLDVSYNTLLTSLGCQSNNLTSLAVSNNTALVDLGCSYNQITELDVRNNKDLKSLQCQNNQLTELDVSQNKKLTTLTCNNNQLEELVVSENTDLVNLTCGNNLLSSLVLDNNKSLVVLDCSHNQLTTLDLRENKELKTIMCGENRLAELNVDSNSKVESLQCYSNELTSLSLDNNIALRILKCQHNQLSALSLTNNLELTTLDCGTNSLTTLDVGGNEKLKDLQCAFNSISSLTASMSVENLNCSNNQLLELITVSGNTCLKTLNCSNNQISNLDICLNPNLLTLACSNNGLQFLNLEYNASLIGLDCKGNSLSSINISKCGGSAKKMSYVYVDDGVTVIQGDVTIVGLTVPGQIIMPGQ